jgi:hypothetical protein
LPASTDTVSASDQDGPLSTTSPGSVGHRPATSAKRSGNGLADQSVSRYFVTGGSTTAGRMSREVTETTASPAPAPRAAVAILSVKPALPGVRPAAALRSAFQSKRPRSRSTTCGPESANALSVMNNAISTAAVTPAIALDRASTRPRISLRANENGNLMTPAP